MNERKSKNVVIIALCLTLIFMGVGFAALSAQLNVTTTATVSGTWDVHFFEANVIPAEEGNQGTITSNSFDTINADNKTTSLNVGLSLVKPGDSATFTVTVKNFGSIKAELSDIESISDASFTDADNDKVLRTIKVGENEITSLTDPQVADLEKEGTTTFTITYTLNPKIGESLQMPEFNTDTNGDGTNDAYVVTDTLHFNYNQA